MNHPGFRLRKTNPSATLNSKLITNAFDYLGMADGWPCHCYCNSRGVMIKLHVVGCRSSGFAETL